MCTHFAQPCKIAFYAPLTSNQVCPSQQANYQNVCFVLDHTLNALANMPVRAHVHLLSRQRVSLAEKRALRSKIA